MSILDALRAIYPESRIKEILETDPAELARNSDAAHARIRNEVLALSTKYPERTYDELYEIWLYDEEHAIVTKKMSVEDFCKGKY